jgi:exosortase
MPRGSAAQANPTVAIASFKPAGEQGSRMNHPRSFFFCCRRQARYIVFKALPLGRARKIWTMSDHRSHIYFSGMALLGFLVFAAPVGELARLALHNETYSHILLTPLISLALLVMGRKSIFSAVQGSPGAGFGISAAGLLLYGIANGLRAHLDRPAFRNQDVPNDYLSLCMAGLAVWVIGSFIAVYGTQAFRNARFPLLFMGFSIPIPMFLLDGIVSLLQYASAEVADLIFQWSGVSYHRSGLVFEFSKLAVKVAEECSGIRSSLALLILSILAGYFFLRTMSRRVILALAVFPITVVKNALRIVVITLLANQVDMRFLTGHWIHRSGGLPFFTAALVLFIPLIWLLRKSESRPEKATGVISNLA